MGETRHSLDADAGILPVETQHNREPPAGDIPWSLHPGECLAPGPLAHAVGLFDMRDRPGITPGTIEPLERTAQHPLRARLHPSGNRAADREPPLVDRFLAELPDNVTADLLDEIAPEMRRFLEIRLFRKDRANRLFGRLRACSTEIWPSSAMRFST